MSYFLTDSSKKKKQFSKEALSHTEDIQESVLNWAFWQALWAPEGGVRILLALCTPALEFTLTYQKDLVGTFAESRVIRAIDGGLTGELCIKLAHVLFGLLCKGQRQIKGLYTL